jgi:hypothetical protein
MSSGYFFMELNTSYHDKLPYKLQLVGNTHAMIVSGQ